MWETSEPGIGNLIRWWNSWVSSLKVILVSRGWEWKATGLYTVHVTKASNMDILQHRPAFLRLCLFLVSSDPSESRRVGQFLSQAFFSVGLFSSFIVTCQKRRKITSRLVSYFKVLSNKTACCAVSGPSTPPSRKDATPAWQLGEEWVTQASKCLHHWCVEMAVPFQISSSPLAVISRLWLRNLKMLRGTFLGVW